MTKLSRFLAFGIKSETEQLQIAAQLAYQTMQNDESLIISCKDKNSAQTLSEFMWNLPNGYFVPNSLCDEMEIDQDTNEFADAVCISWLQENSKFKANTLIYAGLMPDDYHVFQNILYPIIEDGAQLQQLGRTHYRMINEQGYQVQFSKM